MIRGALAAGDRVIYVTPGPYDVALALLEAGGIETRRPLSGGQLLVCTFGEIYGDLARPDVAQLGARFRAALSQSLAAGFPGLRITGEMGGSPWPAGSLEELVRWERMVSQMLGEVGIAAICQYDQRQLDEPATAIIAAEHTGMATNGQRLPLALFIASAPPPALRVEGELDLTNGAGPGPGHPGPAGGRPPAAGRPRRSRVRGRRLAARDLPDRGRPARRRPGHAGEYHRARPARARSGRVPR